MEPPFISAWDIAEGNSVAKKLVTDVTQHRGRSAFMQTLAKHLSPLIPGGQFSNLTMAGGVAALRLGSEVGSAVRIPTPAMIPGVKFATRWGAEMMVEHPEGVADFAAGVVRGTKRPLFDALQHFIPQAAMGRLQGATGRLAKSMSSWRVNRFTPMSVGTTQPGATGIVNALGSAFKARTGLLFLDETGSTAAHSQTLYTNMVSAFLNPDRRYQYAALSAYNEWRSFHQNLFEKVQGLTFNGQPISLVGIKDPLPFIAQRIGTSNIGGRAVRGITQGSAMRFLIGDLHEHFAFPEFLDASVNQAQRFNLIGLKRGWGRGAADMVMGSAVGGRGLSVMERQGVALAGRGTEGVMAQANIALLGGDGVRALWDSFGLGDPGVLVNSTRLRTMTAASLSGYTFRLKGVKGLTGGLGRSDVSQSVIDVLGPEFQKVMSMGSGRWEADRLIKLHELAGVDLSGAESLSRNGRQWLRNFSSRIGTIQTSRGTLTRRVPGDPKDVLRAVKVAGTDLVFEFESHTPSFPQGAMAFVGTTKVTLGVSPEMSKYASSETLIDLITEPSVLKAKGPEGIRDLFTSHYIAKATSAAKRSGVSEGSAADIVAQHLGMQAQRTKYGFKLVPHTAPSPSAPYITGEMFTEEFQKRLTTALRSQGVSLDYMAPSRRALTPSEIGSIVARGKMTGASPEQVAQAQEVLRRGYADVFMGTSFGLRANNPLSIRGAKNLTNRMRLRAARHTYDAFREAHVAGIKGADRLASMMAGGIGTAEGRITQAQAAISVPFMTDSGFEKFVQMGSSGANGWRSVKVRSLSDLRSDPISSSLLSQLAEERAKYGQYKHETYKAFWGHLGFDKDVGAVVFEGEDLRGLAYSVARPGKKGASATIVGASGKARIAMPNPDILLSGFEDAHASGLAGGMSRGSKSLFVGGTKQPWERGSFRAENQLELAIELLDSNREKGALSRRLMAFGIGAGESLYGGKSLLNKAIATNLSGTQATFQIGAGVAPGEVVMSEELFAQAIRSQKGTPLYERALKDFRAGGYFMPVGLRYPVHGSHHVTPILAKPLKGGDRLIKQSNVVFVNAADLTTRWGDTDGDQMFFSMMKNLQDMGYDEHQAALRAMHARVSSGISKISAVRTAQMQQKSAAAIAFARSQRDPMKVVAASITGATSEQELSAVLNAKPVSGIPEFAEMQVRLARMYKPGELHKKMEEHHLVLDLLNGKKGLYQLGTEDERYVAEAGREFERIMGRAPTAADKGMYSQLFYMVLKKGKTAHPESAELWDLIHQNVGRSTEIPAATIDRATEILTNNLANKFAHSPLDPGLDELLSSDPAVIKERMAKEFRLKVLVEGVHQRLKDKMEPSVALRMATEPHSVVERTLGGLGTEISPEAVKTSAKASAMVTETLGNLIPPTAQNGAVVEQVAKDAIQEMPSAIAENVKNMAGAAHDIAGAMGGSKFGKAALIGGGILLTLSMLNRRKTEEPSVSPMPSLNVPMPPTPMMGRPLDGFDVGGLENYPKTARIQRVTGQRRHFQGVHAADVNLPPTPGLEERRSKMRGYEPVRGMG